MATAAFTFFSSFLVFAFSLLIADWLSFRRAGPLQAKRTPIKDVEEGTAVKLVGTVRLSEERVKAPVSGRECAGYEVRVARKKRMRWRPVKSERRGVGFFLDDGSGEVFVPLNDETSVRLCTSMRVRRNKYRSAVRRVLGGLLDEAPARAYRCDEGVLTPGSRVAVYGIVRTVPERRQDRLSTYRSGEFQYVLEPADEGLHVSDDRAAFG